MSCIKKLSDLTYPGFDALREYFDSLQLPEYWDGEDKIGSNDNEVWFADTNDKYMASFMSIIDNSDSEMTKILNMPEFRYFHNLLPAGTDVVSSFCQMMAFKYRKKLGFENLRGTYRVTFQVWTNVTTEKNEAQLSQQVLFLYNVGSGKNRYPVIVCF
ncbi:hypothetical protein [Zooshikella sp. RANM57]|uniref:hypothetical protein n=1 Tax=Zooshikella sp. RANM57 TaxID=3425863 RepID=UPI003D6F5343